jgi:hypothetical protein
VLKLIKFLYRLYVFFSFQAYIYKCGYSIYLGNFVPMSYITLILFFFINNGGFLTYMGAGATGATAPVAQTLWGKHRGNRLPFLPELHLEICALFTGIGI